VAGSKTGRKRAITRAVNEVAHYLGNTPAVCRASYIDPRVFDAYQGGLIVGKPLYDAAAVETAGELPIHQREIEEAVLDLINERERSRAIEKVAA
jgi:DNA topoisomerase I